MSAYRLIKAKTTSFSVGLMCRMLGVSRSGYYDWREGAFVEESPGWGTHREDRGDPPAQQRHLRLSESACRIEVCGRSLFEKVRREADEGGWSAGLHARWEEGNHPILPMDQARRGSRE